MESVIKREVDAKIKREKEPKEIRYKNEVQAAVEMGGRPHENPHTFRDLYEFYQKNEV